MTLILLRIDVFGNYKSIDDAFYGCFYCVFDLLLFLGSSKSDSILLICSYLGFENERTLW